MTTPLSKVLVLFLLAMAVTACRAGSPDPVKGANPASPVVADARLPTVTVYKSPTCLCCSKWVAHLEAAGFPVEIRERIDVQPIKEEIGVPPAMGSCHTAEVDGYFVEGHVPAEDIKRLLAERPEAEGLALPGMPSGSPGMEHPSGRVSPYTVHLVARDGSVSDYSKRGEP